MKTSGRFRIASIAERRIVVKWVALLALWGTASTASAHPEFSPTVTNRYVKFTLLSGRELRVAYTVMFGAAPAAAARRAADANHDGVLDDAETAALGARVAGDVGRGMALDVDGARAQPAFEQPVVGLAGAAVGPSPFSVDLIARVPVANAGGAAAAADAGAGGRAVHVVRFDDATELPELGETEVRIEESPGTTLTEAHRGAEGSEKQTQFLFRGPKFSAIEDRSITFKFADAAAVANGAGAAAPQQLCATANSARFESRGLRRWWWLGIPVLAAAAAALVLLRRRYRKTNG
jgi:hypothetical protein